MTGRRPIGAVDTIWLNMDRPENVMVIDAVMWFDEAVNWDRLTRVVQRRLVNVYPVFQQRPVGSGLGVGVPHWEDDPDFDLHRHVRRARLPEPGDEATLQRFVEEQMHRSFDRDHPLWEVHVLDGFQRGSAVLMRFHHALADGIALAQVMLSLTDDAPMDDLDAGEPDEPPGEPDPHRSSLRRVGGVVSGTASTAASATSSALHLLGGLPHLANPARAVDALTLVQQTGHVANKLLLGHKPETTLSGPPGLLKRAVWSAPRPLAEVKRVGRVAGATVNDVLVAAVSGAISEYLADLGDQVPDLTTMVPINLRPPGLPLPRELGNQFALVMLPMPTGLRVPILRLAETKRRMDAIKSSPEAVLTFGLITAIGRTHPELERYLVNFFAAKTIGVTTNVVGPRVGRYLAGSRIAGVLGWVPGSGEQTLGVCIFTYDSTVRVGFKADADSVPHPERLVAAFDQELDDLLRMATAV